MRFVHVIARLNEAKAKVKERLDDLNEMAMEIVTPFTSEQVEIQRPTALTPPQEAMLALIMACEQVECKRLNKLSKRIKGYEHRREYGG